ncbi:MAG: DUF58 domain-containing protein [Anaerolineales bacterium]
MKRFLFRTRPQLPRYPLIVRRYARPDCLTTIELRQPLLVVAFAIALVWYVAAPAGVVAMGLAALGGLLLAAFGWARAMARGVRAKRRLHYAAVQVGDELEEFISLDNPTHLPVIWAEFVDRSDLPGYHVSSVRAADSRSSIQWRAQAVCARRGVFRLGPWELRLGDPFGIFLVRQVYTQRQELLVYPPLAALPAHLLPHNATLGDHRRLRQPIRAETISALGTRPYAPGDPLRRLHWPTTARKAEPYAKVFDPEATSTVWLIPDFDRAVHLGQGDESTEETMVLLAASLADHLLRTRLSVGLLAASGAEALTVLPPRLGGANLWQFLRVLAPLRATCPWPLAQTLARAQPLVSARALVIVLTPAITADWLGALKQLTGRGGAAEVFLLDPASFGGQPQAEAGVASLNANGFTTHVVRRGEVRPLRATYGALRRWDFMTLGTGRAVTRQTPRRAHAAFEIAHE